MPNSIKKLIVCNAHRHRNRMDAWFKDQIQKTPLPFYSSVDIRDSGYKIAPVDCNLYPAGFNNICKTDLGHAPRILRNAVERQCQTFGVPLAKKLLVIPENHTQNSYYIENIYTFVNLLKNAGFEVELGWYEPEENSSSPPVSLKSNSGKTLTAHPFQIDARGTLSIPGFFPDAIILNNDFSGGPALRLDSVRQPLFPTHRLGWYARKKSKHFEHYNILAAEFAQLLELDPWHFQVETKTVEPVNFNENTGIDAVAHAAQEVMQNTQAQMTRHSISGQPFVFIKNNMGTYGMGVMVIRSPDELLTLNRRVRNKMSVGKNKSPIQSVVVQEGIPTATLSDGHASEPVIYLAGCELLGGFLRSNTEKGAEENLNSQGMVFKNLCMADLRESFSCAKDPESIPLLELVYGSIARLSALAAGREQQDLALR